MEFIFIKKNCVPPIFCELMIDVFNAYSIEMHYSGITYGGLNKNVKDTTDLKMPQNIQFCKNELQLLWHTYSNKLYDLLYESLKECIAYYNTKYQSTGHKFLNFKKMHDTGFLLQKYDKGIGKFTYHNDSGICNKTNSHRVLTYIYYLNTIEEGGETEFFGTQKIKPEQGKLVIFPSCWTYPHCGLVPISDDKYIVTGWFYVKDEDFIGV